MLGSTEQNLKDCKNNKQKCLTQLLLDGAVIVSSYALLLWLVDDKWMGAARAAKFYALFLALAYLFRYLDVDFQETLTRVAGIQIGTKLFGVLG